MQQQPGGPTDVAADVGLVARAAIRLTSWTERWIPDAFIFALLAFAAGFAVRPFGALVFGRFGDLIGRKHTFLVTIVIMGLATFLVGVLPSYDTIGIAAPVALVLLRLLQGLALGGEYGGAATYVAEHAPHGKRGSHTSWIQTTATLGLFLSLLVILACRVSWAVHACWSKVTFSATRWPSWVSSRARPSSVPPSSSAAPVSWPTRFR